MISTRNSFWVVLLLAIICLIATFVTTSDESGLFLHLSYLWIFLLVSSWLFTALSLRGVTLQRTSRAYRQQVGEIFKEQITINNRSLFYHIWIEVLDESNLPLSSSSRIITGVGWNKSRTYQSYTLLNQRGWYTLGPVTLLSGDLFGLFQKTKKVIIDDKLLVTPHIIRLNSFPVPRGYLQGGQRLRKQSGEVSPNAAGVREYYPGDPMNRIHWPSTVRRDRLMVKEFDQDPQTEVWIFIDAQKGVQAAIPEERLPEKEELSWLFAKKTEVKLPSSTFEYSICIAASLANYFIHHGQGVGLASAGQINVLLYAEKTERQIGKIFENLALLHAEGEISLENLVTAQTGHLSKGSIIILITPSTHQSIGLIVNDLMNRGMKPVIILVDPSTFGLADKSEEFIRKLRIQNASIIVVSNHSNLAETLSKRMDS